MIRGRFVETLWVPSIAVLSPVCILGIFNERFRYAFRGGFRWDSLFRW